MSVRCTLPEGRAVDVRAGETLLDACRRSAVEIAFSCRSGSCHTCLLQAVEGEVPSHAQRGLPPELRERNYLLACQCVPTGPLAVVAPDPAHRAVDALLYEAIRAGDFLHLRLELAREPPFQAGDRLALELPEGHQATLRVTAARREECVVEGLCAAEGSAGAWLEAAPFAASVRVRGPLATDPGDEAEAPESDPALWRELGDGKVARQVLEAFYARVYADPLLAPFFAGITQDRAVDKQYSFMRQLLTGDKFYFGDRPRNAHHWMVITDELFAHRQNLMQEELQAAGLTPTQIARWTRVEVHYRRDIVKASAWPKVAHGVTFALDGYAREVLAEGAMCDHCGAAVDAGVEVSYHLRLGTVSCPRCMQQAPPAHA